MDSDASLLHRFLILHQFFDDVSGPRDTLHIQIYPGCGDYASFKLFHEKQRPQKLKEFWVFEKTLLSLLVDEGDIFFIRTTQNDFATAGGIWQVQWQTHYTDGYGGRYVLEEITATGIEMVEVKTLLQEEEFVLFEDAVAYAKTFFESQRNMLDISFVNGREVGVSAPERMHQVTPLPQNIRAVEHTWLLVLSGFKEHYPRTIFSLMEVVYCSQGQEWQFSASVLREGDDYETWSM
jgi:hypothetical protein